MVIDDGQMLLLFYVVVGFGVDMYGCSDGVVVVGVINFVGGNCLFDVEFEFCLGYVGGLENLV